MLMAVCAMLVASSAAAQHTPVEKQIPCEAYSQSAAVFVGVAGPAGMPRPALMRLQAAVAWAMRETDLPRLYEGQGLLPRYAGAEGFAALVARDREKWARVAREAGIVQG